MKFENTFQKLEQPARSHLSCRAYMSDASNSFPKHCHAFYEMDCMLKGKRCVTLNHDTYEMECDSLFLIPPLSIHSFQNLTGCEDLLIQFDHLFLRNASILFDKQYALKPVVNNFTQTSSTRQIIMRIAELCRTRDRSDTEDPLFLEKNLMIDMSINGLCLQLISHLLGEKLFHVDFNGAAYSDVMAIDPLINKLMAHPGKPLKMRDASRSVGMSYAHFSRFFRKVTGFHYAEFCNLLRIRHAEECLLTTSMPIFEVAASVGISTVSYFTRLFKQVNGVTPGDYRRRYGTNL